ncbi:hypothetical protein LSAT2_026284 [Lamellibrachia satsuma]|nr:hypothetical protein LSAT2_026284 [Lamellibrachia satsuma]
MQNQRSVFNRQPVRILVVDLGWPLDGDTCASLRAALERLFAVVCSLSGPQRIQFFGLISLGDCPQRIQFFGLISLGDCPQVLFPLQHVRGNYPRLYAALQELSVVHNQQVHSGMAGSSGLVHSGMAGSGGVTECIHKALSMFRKHAQCTQQAAGCWNQLEISMVTGRNITTVAKQVQRATHDLDLDSLQKVQIICVSSPSLLYAPTLTHDDLMRSSSSQGSSSSDQSRKSELGGLVDLLTVDNDLTSLQGVFTSWLQDVGTDREHLHLILPDSQNDGLRVLQCDIHERLLNPAQLPFLSQFSIGLLVEGTGCGCVVEHWTAGRGDRLWLCGRSLDCW